MAIGVDDILRITARMLWAGNQIQNTYHYLVDVASGGDDLNWMQDIAGIFDDAYAELIGAFSDNLTFEDIIGQNLTKDEVLPAVSWPTLNAGTDAGGDLPPQISFLAYWPTITPRVVGRKFLGVFGEAQQLGGVISATPLANLLDYAFIIEESSFPVAQTRTATPGVWNVDLVRFTELGLSHVNEIVMTQRRRTKGRGS